MTETIDYETSNSLNIEASTPKVIKIVVGERTVLEGVLNTGSVLTVQTKEGAEPQSIELVVEDLAG
ncbi:hypothetical protein G6L26_025855 (plasmid) [Agrobacterium radiobacter]|uniref:Uncharacterized protein n=1 Tax=Agrobacterium tumefaciens str. B6 TaxID=1183423 RepID=A0A822VD50_AGRTU|nr:hypothetical protein [Agrobacterium tumefaciens]KWT81350.1 hypothetical protein ASB65_16615 [Agrobacterium tumefaciens str. B6]MQB27579.1 hypothetical protein [Agrobacterium tumefaciens]NTA05920.1 hypothetical protein [Agrobacterium tumefaciens]NTA94917.1 hypothetical protein [Agrobacterium tumefaciens]NTB13566.1 hypothetical protein [Agrobacterium tumefaciens]